MGRGEISRRQGGGGRDNATGGKRGVRDERERERERGGRGRGEEGERTRGREGE